MAEVVVSTVYMKSCACTGGDGQWDGPRTRKWQCSSGRVALDAQNNQTHTVRWLMELGTLLLDSALDSPLENPMHQLPQWRILSTNGLVLTRNDHPEG